MKKLDDQEMAERAKAQTEVSTLFGRWWAERNGALALGSVFEKSWKVIWVSDKLPGMFLVTKCDETGIPYAGVQDVKSLYHQPSMEFHQMIFQQFNGSQFLSDMLSQNLDDFLSEHPEAKHLVEMLVR